MKKIAVFGASGNTGLQIIQQALEQGYIVNAFTRSPEKLPSDPNIVVHQGDLFDPYQLAPCVNGCNAVLIALGASPADNSMVRARATDAIVQAMKMEDIHRVICMTTIGAQESRSLLKPASLFFFDMFLKKAVKDHEAQEQVLENSDRSWTVVRPARLTNGPKTSQYRVDVQNGDAEIRSISRADVADFMLKQIDDTTYVKKAVAISY